MCKNCYKNYKSLDDFLALCMMVRFIKQGIFFQQIPPFSLHKNPLYAQNIIAIQIKRSNLYMKATGIVRRIDACVIIGQKPINRITTGFFNDFCPNFF